MKKTAAAALSLAIIFSAVFFYKPAYAANAKVTAGSNGPLCNNGVYFSPSGNISVNAGDTITFSVPANDPCSAGVEINNFPGGSFTISPGDKHETPALEVDIPNFYTTCYSSWPSSDCKKSTGSVTVHQPVASPPAAAPPPPAPVATPPPAPPSQPNKPPAALSLDKANVNSDKIDTSKPVSISESQPITLSGFTIANGVVNLTIHSVVRNEIARANSSGFWSFTIADLETGAHTVDATVTDPATHLTSPSATLLKFTIKNGAPIPPSAKIINPIQKKQKKSSISLFLIIFAVLVVLAATAAALWFRNFHKKPKKPQGEFPTQVPPPTEISPSI
jgi:cell division septation protein DedD